METLQETIARLVKEDVVVVPYDHSRLEMFEQERLHLLSCLPLPKDLIKRIEHFGSTAVPGLSAKSIVDILVEVTSLEEIKQEFLANHPAPNR